MSNESSERAQKILELRARFPEADVEIIEEALAHSRFDVCTAAGMLIGFGCKLASRGPTSVSTKPAHLSSAPHAPVALGSGPPCPSAHDAVQPPRRYDLAPSASANQAVQLPTARHNRSSVFDDFKPDYVERALGDAKGAEVEALEILLALGDSALASRSAAPSFRASVPQHSASSAHRTDLLVSRKQSPSLPPAHPGETLSRATADLVPQQRHSRVELGHDQAAHSTATVHPSGNAEISVPLAMFSTAHQIQQAQMESRALFEQEMRSKKIHVFVDLSNVSIGAQVGPDGKRDMNMRINVPELVQCVHQGRDVKGRFVITSIAGTLEANRQPAFIRDWEKAGYVVRVQERRGGSEQMLDEVLISSMQQTILRFGASKLGAGPGQKQHTLVLLSGDGNTNHDHHSFAETIQLALSDGMFVEIWAWKNSVSKVYTKSFMEHYGGSFSVRYFDDHRDRIVSARFLAATADFSVQHDNDDDDDWMFCPITFQAIEDAAATKFAPKRYYERCSLEAWVRGHGCCPLTRKSCTIQVQWPPSFCRPVLSILYTDT